MPHATLRFPIDGIRLDGIRLDGGRPCLDFVNTVHDRFAAVPQDYWAAPAQYREWCVRAGLLSRHEAEGITMTAGILAEARRFRDHLHALLSARIDGTPLPAASLRHCEHWLHRAWSSLMLDPASSEGVSWQPAAIDARLPLKRIALSALEVLKDLRPRRLKRCASADSCGWLFYDDSKGGRRRWCSMDTCGTVEKMRRYRRS